MKGQKRKADEGRLDQWLLANTTFGPGSDATINPYITTYPGLASQYQYNNDLNLTYQNPTIPYPQQIQPHSGLLMDGNNGMYPQTQIQPGVFNGSTLNNDALGLGLGVDQTSMSLPGTHPTNGNGQSESASNTYGNEENNDPTVFWDRLIDGIVVGQGYDPRSGTI